MKREKPERKISCPYSAVYPALFNRSSNVRVRWNLIQTCPDFFTDQFSHRRHTTHTHTQTDTKRLYLFIRCSVSVEEERREDENKNKEEMALLLSGQHFPNF